MEGENRKILSVERTALNVLGRMSGVATLCRKAKEIAGNNTTIALTRKTIPGFNVFDKKAAEAAGAWPHRKNLEDAILIKDNHLMFISIGEAVRRAKQTKKFAEVEVKTWEEAIEAIEAEPDMVMLDNFPLKEAAKAVREIRSKNRKIKIELSGGISLENLADYAKLKPDYISLGFLTKAAETIDFSVDFV
ncbi:carboxylating nicotinate-nucleotide diphosphorylase [Candidatus Micrarchaeota archaeon]|nr:carboxylating nicotinate-nucleotide diphosphorylase [Candidatus Micrarchaeota archaeon]